MKKLALLLLASLSSLSYALSAEDIASQLQEKAESQGQFTQTRTLRDISEPLISRGHYALKKGELHWQLEQPFPAELKITQNGIYQKQDGQWLPLPKNQTQQQTQLFLGLLNGDWQALAHYFDIQATGTRQNWQLTLTPNNSTIQQIFTSILLEGDRHSVRHIRIKESQGDNSDIQFNPQP